MATHGTTEAPKPTSPSSPAPAPFAERDVRRKRPPALSFLLRMDTLRRVARALSLLALDLAALFAAILTALALKAAARDVFDLSVAFNQAKDYVSFASWSPRCCSRRPASTATARCARGCRASWPGSSRSRSWLRS